MGEEREQVWSGILCVTMHIWRVEFKADILFWRTNTYWRSRNWRGHSEAINSVPFDENLNSE